MIHSKALRGSWEKACKQNFSNFHFSASSMSVRMQVILSESYKLAVFYEIIATTFGVLLKICVWPPQFYFWVLHSEIKARLEMVMRMHSGPGTGLHRWIMWQIIILPTMGHMSPVMCCNQIIGHLGCSCYCPYPTWLKGLYLTCGRLVHCFDLFFCYVYKSCSSSLPQYVFNSLVLSLHPFLSLSTQTWDSPWTSPHLILPHTP